MDGIKIIPGLKSIRLNETHIDVYEMAFQRNDEQSHNTNNRNELMKYYKERNELIKKHRDGWVVVLRTSKMDTIPAPQDLEGHLMRL